MKKCKICSKTNKNPLNKCCSVKCDSIYQKEKRKVATAKKRASSSYLTKVADILWSKIIRQAGECAYCGSTEHLNAHHIFSRSNRSTRWDLDNWICLCAGHHTFSNEFSAHKTPTEFTYWLEEKWWVKRIENIARQARSVDKVDIQEVIDKLKPMLEKEPTKWELLEKSFFPYL